MLNESKQMITEELAILCHMHTGSRAEEVTALPSSGSNRRYFNITSIRSIRVQGVFSAQPDAEHLHKKFGVKVDLVYRKQNIEQLFDATT